MADATTNTPAKTSTPRQRTLVGVVTRDSNAKTRRVDVERLVKHPRYGKYLRERTICYVHDEANVSGMGDVVEIVESRPLSKTKNWRVVANKAGRPTVSRCPMTSTQPRSSSCLITMELMVTPRMSSISPRVAGCR